MISDELAWDAVLRRDRALDGRLYFGVTSTGVYCRPSCPARRPLRTNVRFFEAAGDAERAGFRACLRCGKVRQSLADRVRAILDASESITLGELAQRTQSSAHHLQRAFKRQFGVSPRQYLAARRAERLKQRLREGSDVTTATYDAGYGSSSRLYSESNARLGMTPATYRRGGRGMHIRYALVTTSLGRMLVGTTDRGVCAVSLGDDDAALEQSLRDEFPHATFELTDAPRNVIALIESGEGDVALDLDATTIQLKVWDALRRIPRGETRTYSEIAGAIGAPKAARAVANACANNRVAIVIPCHRVVRGDGEPGGYRWGAARKRKLLDRERT
jgi:AraC family transcriptional regulator of adaptative response/methylated-DNA-[protein]-cysteine methyltransferase